MLKLMIVAGNQAAKLADHLTKTGAFRADYVFTSLSENQEKIKNSIIKVDKLLYIYQPDESKTQTSIRGEMGILQELLTVESFFSANEIIFMQKNGQYAKQATEYFSAVMKECNESLLQSKRKHKRVTYAIKVVDGPLSFQIVQDYLLGVTKADDFSNTSVKVYRFEKGNDANTAYVQKDNLNSKVEPFSFENLESYDRERENALKMDSGSIFRDDNEININVLDSPEFGMLQIATSESSRNVSIISGENKAGKSIWAVALARSAEAYKKRVLLLDVTYNQDIERLVSSHDITFFHTEMLQILNNKELDESYISICQVSAADKNKVLDFMYVLCNKLFPKQYDHVFIVCEQADLQAIHKAMRPIIDQIFYCTYLLQDSILTTKRYVGSLKEQVTILCNDYTRILDPAMKIEPQIFKEKLAPNLRVIAPIWFEHFNLDSVLYLKLVEE